MNAARPALDSSLSGSNVFAPVDAGDAMTAELQIPETPPERNKRAPAHLIYWAVANASWAEVGSTNWRRSEIKPSLLSALLLQISTQRPGTPAAVPAIDFRIELISVTKIHSDNSLSITTCVASNPSSTRSQPLRPKMRIRVHPSSRA